MLAVRVIRPRFHIKQLQRGLTNKTAIENDDVDTSDVFGTLSESGKNFLDVQSAEKLIEDDPDGYDKEEFDYEPRKNAYYYKYEIRDNARQGATGLRKALELYQEMKSKAKLEPSYDQFAPLIYGCAKAGYTKRAFELFEESLKYLNKPTNSMLTCLINACAESPFPEYGLKRLDWLITYMKVNYTSMSFNLIHYNSAIKAYGKLGRLDEAAKLIQTMVDNGIYPDIKTFSMLLMGCVSDKKSGCTIALRIFKRMKMYDLKPDTVIYNMLLRCIRDCEMGSPELIRRTLQELPAISTIDQRIHSKIKKHSSKSRDRKHPSEGLVWVPLLEDLGKSINEAIKQTDSTQVEDESVDNSDKNARKEEKVEMITISSDVDHSKSLIQLTSDQGSLPNLLSDDHLHLLSRIRAIKLDKLNDRYNRMLLFGGLEGFLEAMLRDGCRPELKTFSLLLTLFEPSHENYLHYFELSNTFKIQRDVLFYDILISEVARNRKLVRNCLTLALHFVGQMPYDNLRPNISIYEALAGCCSSWKLANQLICDLEKNGFRITDRLIKELFYAALSSGDLDSLNHLVDLSRRREFKPTKTIVDKLENFRLYYRQLLLDHEKGIQSEIINARRREITDRDVELYDNFKRNLGLWLSRVEIQEEEHPWSQFDVETKSKKDGFIQFRKHLNAMNKVKHEALKRGQTLGNVSYKAEKMVAARGHANSSRQTTTTNSKEVTAINN